MKHPVIIVTRSVLAGALWLALLAPVRAEVADLSAFGRLPVQEGGRVMPMDSYARLKLLQLSGKSSYDRQPAIRWVARAYFAPAATERDRVFLVNHPEVTEALGIVEEGRRFSFDQLKAGLDQLQEMAEAAARHEDAARSPVEKEILRLSQSMTTYLSLRHAFQFAVPHPDFTVSNKAVRARFGLAEDAVSMSFLDVYQAAPAFAAEVQAMAKTDPVSWDAGQTELFRLSSALYQWSQFYRGVPPALLPLQGHRDEPWVSPWDLLAFGFQDETTKRDTTALQAMARAYREGNQGAFDLAAQEIERSVLARAPASRSLRHLGTELRYNALQPFYRAEVLYGLGFLLALAAMMTGSRWVRRAALAAVLLALVPHTVGLIWRMQIMGRPPMTNLYATFLFVSWVCVALGLVVEALQRNALGSVLAGAAGLAFLMVAHRFSSQGDTLGVVVAVLDSNFWLATHVVTISMGYAGCLAAGLAGHLYLLQAIRRPDHDPRLRGVGRAIYGLLAFGLVFSFLGTMLGGVWADQSWGRFWGWDPKENGALLIVLWCAILFHARVAGMIGPVGLAAGSVLGVNVVLVAWLGINLLGVGLHSYGFTSGLAAGLWASIAFEVLFTAAAIVLIARGRTARGCR